MATTKPKVLSTRFTAAEIDAVTVAMERSHVGNLHAYMRIAVLSLAGVSELPEQLRRRDGADIAAAVMCVCGHCRGDHYLGGSCEAIDAGCDCPGFIRKDT